MARQILTTITFATVMLSVAVAFAWTDYNPLSWEMGKHLPWLSQFVFKDGATSVGPEQSYRTSLLSRDPLVIYIEDFVSEAEMDYLLDLHDRFSEPAKVYPTNGEPYVDKDKRFSNLTFIDRADAVVQGIGARALEFQGSRPNVTLEDPYVQRYGPGGHFMNHYDWIGDESAAARGSNRLSTFLIYLESDCTEGGTRFPRIPPPGLSWNGKWCERIECEDDLSVGADRGGTTIRPIRGNAVFWMNLDRDLKGDTGTLHRGMPVGTGAKTVMNLFTAVHWDP
ncbi:hypothetical protein PRZ48_006766 [Zasmidium cellare]|uniref:Fe2OG dioxygenase domain-containing protein n=1 Tax=Zasmidium cellare TaxID=395010 RepID=A0ABR0EHI7_ZASCE|nr:hypothetical protein PRZ48_006766 [Zasmidium cellare]